jgi:hypothetical protein
MVLLGFRRGRAFPPKRCVCSLIRFNLPPLEQIRSDPVTPTRLRDVAALDSFLDDLPLLFRSSIYTRFPAHAASCLEALNHTEFGSLV